MSFAAVSKESYMPKLICDFSTKMDGNMSINWGEEKEAIENRERWLKKQNINYEDCVFMSLVHGTDINMATEKDKGKIIEGDGLITAEKNVALFMTTGDCLPAIFYDEKSIGLAHLGWKGVRGKLAPKMAGYFDNPRVVIGPGARKESYIKYGEKLDFFLKEIAKSRQEWEPFLIPMEQAGWMRIDLEGYATKQLIEAGVKAENIEISPIDTIKDSNYFSHYRVGMKIVPEDSPLHKLINYDPKEKEGRFATVAMLK